jgi:hypothetical protein
MSSSTDTTLGDRQVSYPSIYEERGRRFVSDVGPETCMTASIETVDDDRSSSLLGVLPPS